MPNKYILYSKSHKIIEHPPCLDTPNTITLIFSQQLTLLPVAAALLAILTWSLAVGSSLGGITSGRLLPIAALLTIATLLSIAARLPVGVLLRVTALIVTSRLGRGVAGRRIGWWCGDWLHGVAPRYLGITVVTLSIS